ncbi:hypothetical protein F5Y12DRAFT_794065 [Xylaria sp. FL1777]|nr:hypothetical protein F5Y12DRAFT_794065 [Xylaria sp. FL1777]
MPGATLPTPDEIAWMLSRPNDSRIPDVFASGLITFTAATIFIGLRLWSRQIARGRLALDVSDWFAVAAWFLFLVFTVSFLVGTKYGAGKHAVFVTDARILGIMFIVQENLYASTLACLKLSILSLYRNIFGASLTFYRWTWVVSAFVAEWFLQVVLSTNLQCVPISAAWDPTVKATCINYGIEALVAYLINIITDLVILSMPIPIVLKLNTSKAQKRRLIISFAAGGRLCLYWTIIPSSILGDVELAIGFLATSVATYRPLYRFIFKDSLGKTTGRRTGSGFSPYHGSSGRNHFRADATPGARRNSDANSGESRRGIVVTNHIELSRHNAAQGSWIKVDDEP